MHYLFNKKAFMGLVALIMILSMLLSSAGVNTVDAEGGNASYIPLVNIGTQVNGENVIFGPNATWKYLDNGTVPSSGWLKVNFDDSQWGSGSAPLGYGNGDERTVVSYGSDPNHKYRVTFFRKVFNLSDVSSIASLGLDLEFDDGVVVFLNGREVARENMPPGTTKATSFASSCIDRPATKRVILDKRYLSRGDNVISVAVHQCSDDSSDLRFGLALIANPSADSAPGPVPTTAPTPTIAPTIAPTTAPTIAPTVAPTTAPTTAPTAEPTSPPTTGESVVFGPNATWKFLDNGSVPASGWLSVNFDDSSWGAGSAPLGYGIGDERTIVSYGSDPNNKYRVTFFRKVFNIADVSSISALAIDLVRDDGAVIFLNGKEVARSNMPEGTTSATAYASSCVDDTTPIRMNIDRNNLVNGDNVFSVAVHQCSDNSSDLRFGLALVANPGTTSGSEAPAPTATPATQPTVAPTAQVTSEPTLPPTSGNQFYVTTSGSSSGNGSMSSPWSLDYAFSHPSALRSGDTIWVRGGTYRGQFTSRLNGTSSAYVTIRAYPGERAILLNNDQGPVLDIYTSSYTNYWGLEITSSYASRTTSRSEQANGLRTYQSVSSHHLRFINMLIHDVAAQGFAWWQAMTDSEVYGSLIYYNGTTQLDHGIYTTNLDGTHAMVDNMIFDNASHGVHAYTESSTKALNNLYLEGNTLFNNGSIGYTTTKDTYGIYKRNILVGGTVVVNNATVTNNFTYYPGTTGASLNLGYKAGSTNSRVTNNYFAGGEFDLGGTQTSLTMTGNTVYAPAGVGGFSTSSYPNNAWSSSKPGDTRIFVRPNRYENNRANLTIYNWNKANSIAVPAASLGGIALKAGDTYELHNAQNFYGDVVTGVYDGNQIVVPMTGHSVAQPLGLNFRPASTFPEFGAFILIVRGQ